MMLENETKQYIHQTISEKINIITNERINKLLGEEINQRIRDEVKIEFSRRLRELGRNE